MAYLFRSMKTCVRTILGGHVLKEAVLSKFDRWAQNVPAKLLAQLQRLPETTDGETKRTSIEQQIRILERKMGTEDELGDACNAHVEEARKEAGSQNNQTLKLVVNILASHKLIDASKDFAQAQPDEKFMQDWAAPEMDDEAASNVAMEEGIRPYPASLMAYSLGLSDKAVSDGDPDDSVERRPSGLQRLARKRLGDRRYEQRNIERQFGQQREEAMHYQRDETIAAGRVYFQQLVDNTRYLDEVQEKFREARKYAKEQGVGVVFSDQTSYFPSDPGCEERERKKFIRFIGPERYPKIQKWADELQNLDLVDSVYAEQIGWTGPEPEMD